MPSQEQQRPSRREDAETEEAAQEPLPTATSSSAAQTTEDDVDSLLDEIDDVLESNAEQFVRQYTQKGGQ